MDVDFHAMISIQADHAENIVKGMKSVELRRKFMSLPTGSRLWIYSTLPVGAIVATAIVKAIDYDEPKALWLRYSADVAISQKHFFRYFDGCKFGYAIQLVDVETIFPIPLNIIRRIRGVDNIPQVAVRISTNEASKFGSFKDCNLRLS